MSDVVKEIARCPAEQTWIWKTMGENIRSRRKYLGYSQDELYKQAFARFALADKPCADFIQDVENGTTSITEKHLVAIANALFCPSWLLLFVGEPLEDDDILKIVKRLRENLVEAYLETNNSRIGAVLSEADKYELFTTLTFGKEKTGMSDSNIWHPLTEKPPLSHDGDRSVYVLLRYPSENGYWQYAVVCYKLRPSQGRENSNKWYWIDTNLRLYGMDEYDESQWTLIPGEEE